MKKYVWEFKNGNYKIKKGWGLEEIDVVNSGLVLFTKDSAERIRLDLIFSCFTDQYFFVCKGDTTRCRSISLIIWHDLDFSMLEDTDAGICGAQVNSNCRSPRHVSSPQKIKFKKYIIPLRTSVGK